MQKDVLINQTTRMKTNLDVEKMIVIKATRTRERRLVTLLKKNPMMNLKIVMMKFSMLL